MSLPPVEVPSGAMRFNSDSYKLEYYDGSQWLQVSTFSPNLNGGARGVFFGGRNPTLQSTIDYITISSTGNAISFGTLTAATDYPASCSSNVRGICAGGRTPGDVNTIEFVTISSTGNAQDFGDLTQARRELGGLSSQTRGVFGGGTGGGFNTIDYITIASQGVNAQDFGDLVQAQGTSTAFASPTRGIFAGGEGPTPLSTQLNIIQFITIATIGNAQDFGDLTAATWGVSGCSNSTRGLIGNISSPARNQIDYITIATTGNAVNFGDLSYTPSQSAASTSSSTRGIWGGGEVPGPTGVNSICYVSILTQGDAVDFGDLTVQRGRFGACSNAHGGL